MNKDLKNKLNTFWDVCEKGPSRYRSWIWCYEKFQNNFFGKEPNEETYDYLALNLAFYLASWGMYRGSSLILQLDYKVYIGLLEKLYESKIPKAEEIKLKDNIQNIATAYEEILTYFNEKRAKYDEKFHLPEPTATLATKILMGIYGITPAFDRFFIEGVRIINRNKEDKFANIRNLLLSNEIKMEVKASWFESAEKDKFIKAYEGLVTLAEKLKLKQDKREIDGIQYNIPIMKTIDTIFWQIGYEASLYELVDEYNKSQQKSDEKFKKIEKLCAYCGKECTEEQDNKIKIT